MMIDNRFDLIPSVDIEALYPFESTSSRQKRDGRSPVREDGQRPREEIVRYRDRMDIEKAYFEDKDGQRYDLRIGIIGKGGSADVKIMTSNYISRKHAGLSLTDGGLFLQDLGSRNGTSVNGIRIMGDGRIPLRAGDLVTLGDTDLILKYSEAVHEI